MTEYLILTLERAIPLVWEYLRQVSAQTQLTYPTVQASTDTPLKLSTQQLYEAGSYTSYTVNTLNHRLFFSFKTPTEPTLPQGIGGKTKPRLYYALISASSYTGSPKARLELWLADQTTRLPSTKIRDLTGEASVPVYDSTSDPWNGVELDWNTWYSIMFVPTFVNSSNYWSSVYLYNSFTGVGIDATKAGLSTDGGSTWTAYDNYMWKGSSTNPTRTIFYYYLENVKDFLGRYNQASRYYYSYSMGSLPSGVTFYNKRILIDNSPQVIDTAQPVTMDGWYEIAPFIHTTADITSAFTPTLTVTKTLRYNVNPVDIGMFNMVESYITRIDFLDTGTTNTVKLNNNIDQQFSGSGGTSLTFDPPLIWWSAEVLSGKVRITAVCFE